MPSKKTKKSGDKTPKYTPEQLAKFTYYVIPAYVTMPHGEDREWMRGQVLPSMRWSREDEAAYDRWRRERNGE